MYLMTLAWISMAVYLITPNEAVVGFDCKTQSMNALTISTLEVTSCDTLISDTSKKAEVQNVDIQLVQFNEFNSVEVIQCLINVKRTVFKCDRSLLTNFIGHEEIEDNPEGFRTFIVPLSEEECINAHAGRAVHLFGKLNNHVIDKVPQAIGEIITQKVDIVGWINEETKQCKNPARYQDDYGVFNEVVVSAEISILLNKETAKLRVEESSIYLQSGTKCNFRDRHCCDLIFGDSFWNTAPGSEKNQRHSVIYNGTARVSTLDKETLYTVESSSVSFSLLSKENVTINNKKYIRTEHPKLFIYTGTDNLELAESRVENDDLFMYANSKFVYLERHIRKQVENLHHDFRKNHCELERKMLINRLSIAIIQPDEFAYRVMGKPGYMAVLAGEVIHIVECTRVELIVPPTDKCYEYLPVTIEQSSDTDYREEFLKLKKFITPQKHILVDSSEEIPCTKVLPQYWRLPEKKGSKKLVWYHFSPEANKAADIPITLQPSASTKWEWKAPDDLATLGVYSQKDLDKVNFRVMAMFTQKARTLQAVEQETYEMKERNNFFGGILDNVMSNIMRLMPNFVKDFFKTIANWFNGIGEWIKKILFWVVIVFLIIVLIALCKAAKSLKGIMSVVFYPIVALYNCMKKRPKKVAAKAGAGRE